MQAIFINNDPAKIDRVYSCTTKDTIENFCRLHSQVITRNDFAAAKNILGSTDFVFSTWDIPVLSLAEIQTFMPNLKAVFYAAGSVQSFARPYLEAGIRIISGWQANAVPVAEFAVAQIILANKGFFRKASENPLHFNGEMNRIFNYV